MMSILPVGVLYFFYYDIREKGYIEITEGNFAVILTFVVSGVAVGYFAMRQILKSIVDITASTKVTLEEILGPEKIRNLHTSSNEVAVLAKSFNEITSRLEENIRNLELAKKTLHSVLAKVGEGISSMENIDSFLNLIIETVTDALQSRVGILLMVDDKKSAFNVKAIYGKNFDNKKALKFDMMNGIFHAVMSSKKPTIIEKIPRDNPLSSLIQTPMLCAPLILHDDVLGIIAISGRKTEQRFDEEEKNLLYNLALQTAVALENAKLNEDAEKTYFETISALALAVEARDSYSRGHLDRVANYVVKVATALNLSQEDIKTLRDAARLHDIGKIGVTDKVLSKEGPLTSQEMEMMKKHCEIGEGIIRPIRSLRMLCDIVRHHHEKLDGSGYPDGLKGDQIHLLVRILTVVDIFDALTTSRPYRKAYTKEEAFEKLKSMKDQVDRKIIDVLIKTVQSY